MITAAPDETLRLEQEVWFDGYQYGSTTGIPDGQIVIQRSSDSLYWNGIGWQINPVQVATTVDAGGLFHYYDFTVGSTANESYIVRMRVNNDVETEAVFNLLIVEAGTNIAPVVDAIGLTTGIPFTVQEI